MKAHRIKGIFCISLDFEKYWGVQDVCTADSVQERFRRIEDVVYRMLQLFEKHNVGATWATVGLLNHGSLEELIQKNSHRKISYHNPQLSPFPLNTERYAQIPFELLSGKKEIAKILSTPRQEFASHTYAHFYTLEKGQTFDEFKADTDAMTILGNELQRPFRSIVFPRNQVSETYLPYLQNSGYAAYRGNQLNRYWSNSTFESEGFLKKTMRYMDAYFPVSKTAKLRIDELTSHSGLVNIPASRFLRPYSGKKWLEKRKLKRIQNEMQRAAEQGTIYHLWWHPHNFSGFPDESLAQLEQILDTFSALRSKHGFESLTLSEIAAHVKK